MPNVGMLKLGMKEAEYYISLEFLPFLIKQAKAGVNVPSSVP